MTSLWFSEVLEFTVSVFKIESSKLGFVFSAAGEATQSGFVKGFTLSYRNRDLWQIIWFLSYGKLN